MMAKPPAAFTSSPNLMSVPRPAMLVAMVTAPGLPAFATTSASAWCRFALSTWCSILRMSSIRLSSSLTSTVVVPTRTGRPASLQLHHVFNDRVELLPLGLEDQVVLVHSRATGRFVGIDITSSFVDVPQLLRLRLRRTRHARELVVHPEVILQG